MRYISSKWNRILVGILACLTVAFAIAAGSAMRAHAEPVINNSEIEEVYDFGTSLELPTKATVDGQEKTAEAVFLTYPNGITTKKSPSVLNQAGEYELQYIFSVSGKTVRYLQRFKVAIPGFSYNDPKSSVEIGANERFPQIPVGAQIRLVNRDELTFREIVNLADNTEDSPFLTLYALPQTAGEFDAAKIKVRITDLYDAENYVDIYIKSNAKEDVTSIGATYLTAGAKGQPSTGLEDNTASNKGVNVRQNDQFGFPAEFSLAGAQYSEGSVVNIDYDELNLYFDAATKQVLTDPSGYCSNARLIADLDDTSYFSNPWKGFTTGEVRISIMGLEYQASALNLVVTELDGKLPLSSVTDGEKPTIKVDTDAFSSGNFPFARVGESFPLFPATAFDAHDGAVQVVSMVFYNYASSNPINCNTTDNSFVPTRPGLYTIVYQARDLSGNVAIETVDVHAYAGAPLEIGLTDPIGSTKTGEPVELVKALSATSVSGRVRYFISVADSDGNVTEVDPESRLFTPMKVGSYIVTVTARDYVSEATKTFPLEATENAVGKIFGEADIPRAFLKGATYTLPTVYGYDFSSGTGVKKEAQIYIKEDNGQSVLHSGNTYRVQASSEVTIEYAITVNGGTDKKTYTVPVVDAGFKSSLNQAKLFRIISGAASGKATSDGVSYTTSTEGTTLEFVNSLQAVDFNLSFLVDGANHAFTGIHVTLTDALNSAESVRFSFEKISGRTMFSVNGGIRYGIDASFEGATRTSFLVNYSAATKSVQAANNLTVSVQTYENGQPFKGFSSDFVYLQVEYTGVSGSSAIIFQNLNKHRLGNATTDRYAPDILVTATPGNRNKGDVVSLSAAVVADVIDAAVTRSLTVTGPNGQPVTALDGTLLKDADPTKDYQFVLSAYGGYLISYTASDSTGNKSSYSYNIAAVDETPPVITIISPVTSGKVGEQIAIAAVEVTDDVTANCEVVVFVEGSNGSYELITDGYFIPKAAGEYRVRYLAMDEAGCCAVASYTVTVQ